MIGIHHGRGVVALMKRPISGEHDLGVRIGEITLRLGFGRGRGRRLCSLAGGGVVIIATLTGLGFGLFVQRILARRAACAPPAVTPALTFDSPPIGDSR